ncbi:hypothetical protein [Escherichia coli]|uniref:hypothetical protein n=1 Tax=Escherichia coli TaxID=562 RepID=UPI0032E9DC72
MNLWWRMTARVFYRITPDRNCGITEAVTVPAREVIHDRFNCFFHPLIGLPPVYAAGLAATQGHHIQEIRRLFQKWRQAVRGD